MSDFDDLVAAIPSIGVDWHRDAIIENSRRNAPFVKLTLRDVPATGGDVLVISAGPSLYRNGILNRIKDADYTGTIVAIDGAYVQCLRVGLIPQYVMTLDPHPTRIVRWFGDPDFEKNSAGDDYFARQDLDENFRENSLAQNRENIDLVDRFAFYSGMVVCTTAPENVVARTDFTTRYWFSPLVDNPRLPGSLTREIAEITQCPALNTGGTVGTAAIMFAHQVLKADRIGVVGMDLGYAAEMPLERTQSWNMLKDRPNAVQYYPRVNHPLWGECYTDPTYFWYRQNLLKLLKSGGITLHNCTGGGALYGSHVECCELEQFLHG